VPLLYVYFLFSCIRVVLTDKALGAIFDRVDTDKSGSIDQDELFNALSQTGIKFTRQESVFMMKHADKDGDGVLSKEEWRNAVQSAYAGKHPRRNILKRKSLDISKQAKPGSATTLTHQDQDESKL
jgi:hypothetical protein